MKDSKGWLFMLITAIIGYGIAIALYFYVQEIGKKAQEAMKEEDFDFWNPSTWLDVPTDIATEVEGALQAAFFSFMMWAAVAGTTTILFIEAYIFYLRQPELEKQTVALIAAQPALETEGRQKAGEVVIPAATGEPMLETEIMAPGNTLPGEMKKPASKKVVKKHDTDYLCPECGWGVRIVKGKAKGVVDSDGKLRKFTDKKQKDYLVKKKLCRIHKIPLIPKGDDSGK